MTALQFIAKRMKDLIIEFDFQTYRQLPEVQQCVFVTMLASEDMDWLTDHELHGEILKCITPDMKREPYYLAMLFRDKAKLYFQEELVDLFYKVKNEILHRQYRDDGLEPFTDEITGETIWK